MALSQLDIQKKLRADISDFNRTYRCAFTGQLTFSPAHLVLEDSSGQKFLSLSIYDLFVLRDDAQHKEIIASYLQLGYKLVDIQYKRLPPTIELFVGALCPDRFFANCHQVDNYIELDDFSRAVISWICQTDRKLLVLILRSFSATFNVRELIENSDISSDVASFVHALTTGFLRYGRNLDILFAESFIRLLQSNFKQLQLFENLKISTGQTLGELANAQNQDLRIKELTLNILIPEKRAVERPIFSLLRPSAEGASADRPCAPSGYIVVPTHTAACAPPLLPLLSEEDLDDKSVHKKLAGTSLR